MARWFQLSCVALLFVFAFVQMGESLECYHCTGQYNSDCNLNPANNPSFKKNCTNADEICYIRNTTLIGGGQINRDCAPKTECGPEQSSRAMDHNTTCITCATRLCNTSTNITPLSFFIISIISVIFARILSK